MATIRLVTRADDAGLNHSTNRAIRAAVKQGIVRNVSLLATTPSIEDGSEVLADLDNTVNFGLHVCLTSEWRNPRYRPLNGNVQSMVRDDGSFPSSLDELATHAPKADEITNEVTAQYEKLISLGFKLSYLDEHMSIGNIAGIADVLTDFAKAHELVYDRTLRNAQVISPLVGWQGPGPHPGTELADHLSSIPAGTYLVVGHPGFKSDEMQLLRHDAGDDYDALQERNRQRRMFADIEIVDYCDTAPVKLLKYSDL